LSLPQSVSAQQADVVVFGMIKQVDSGTALNGHAVDAIDQKWGRRVRAITGESGKYEIELVRDADWVLEYVARGHQPKRVRMELRGPTADEWLGGFGMNIDMTLYKDEPGVDLTLGGAPIGVCRYDADSGNFVWDLEYTKAMKLKLEAARAEKGAASGVAR
jgi:hypothetical protein